MASTGERVRQGVGKWLGRLVRVTLGLGAVGVAAGLVAVRVSYADASEAGLDFGKELHELGEHHPSGDMDMEVYELTLNGQPFSTETVGTGRSMKDVLDYFQSECTTNSVGMGEALGRLGPTLKNLPKSSGVPGVFVFRKDAEDRSFIFCIAPDHELSLKEQFARARTAVQTGDIGTIGDIRYINVLKDRDGATVTSMWTRGTFNVNAMFPKVGDAPGEDIGAIPRPEGARRILTAHIVGAPFGLNVYETPGLVGPNMAALDATLTRVGWKRFEMPDQIKTPTHVYSLGKSTDIVVTPHQAKGGRTSFAYMVSRGIEEVSH